MKKLSLKFFVYLAALTVAFSSCSNDDDDYVYPTRPDGLRYPNSVEVERADAYKTVKGFYLISQGNMGSNNSNLSFYNAPTGDFYKDIFKFYNPSIAYGLGDTPNDIQILGDNAYIPITNSHIVVVIDTKTNSQVKEISIKSPRNIAFSPDGKYAYVTTTANLGETDNADNGALARVELATDKIDYLPMSYGPEGLVVRDNKVYVANSWQNVYSNKLIIVDIANGAFKIKSEKEVAVNLTKTLYDSKSGNIYIVSTGDYSSTNPSKIIIIDKSDEIFIIDKPVKTMAIGDDYIYGFSSYGTYPLYDYNYFKIKISNNEYEEVNFLDSEDLKELVNPSNIVINPETKDFYITDAKSDFNSPGAIFCFGSNGKYKWSAITGISPASIAFSKYELKGLK